MSRFIVSMVLVACGCFTSAYADDSHPIAICNVRQVVDELGIHDAATAKLRKYEQTLATRLKQLQASYIEQVAQEERQLSDDPTVEDLKKIRELKAKLDTQFKKVRDESVRDFESLKKRLVANVRGEISRVAKKIAVEHGFSIVLDGSSEIVLAYQTFNVDITHLVIDEMRKRIDEADALDEQPPQVEEAGIDL